MSVLLLHVGAPQAGHDDWDLVRAAPLRRAVAVAGNASYGPGLRALVAVSDAGLPVLASMDEHVLVVVRLEPAATDADRALAEIVLGGIAPNGHVVDASLHGAADPSWQPWRARLGTMTVATIADGAGDTIAMPGDRAELVELVTALARYLDGNRQLDDAMQRNVTREANLIFEEVDLVADLVLGGPQGVLVDVGAHHGTSARRFADAGWRVLAFEPDPDNRAILEGSLGRMPNVSIDPRALGSEPRTDARMYRSDESTGISSLSPFHATHVAGGLVDISTVTQVCADAGVTGIDVLKIDVEGHDLDVLRGTDVAALRPSIIIAEFEDRKTVPMGHTVGDIAEFLEGHGYEVWCSEWHPIIRYGIRHQWRGIERWPCGPSQDSWGNLIAFRDGVEHTTILAAVASQLGLG
ncbi:MAG: FkbM family methyltransferase [Myxococcota bacterium]